MSPSWSGLRATLKGKTKVGSEETMEPSSPATANPPPSNVSPARRHMALPTHFQHTLIQETHIRLLSYSEDWDCRDRTTWPGGIPSLTCEIFERSSAPEYLALSYEWGSSDSQSQILLNNVSMMVRANLFNALKFLPFRLLDHFWIDALCIDQANVTERNHQVKAMGDTYSQAESVIVWLGVYPGSRHPEPGCSFYDRFYVNPYLPRQDHMETADLISLSYWTRMWIWQEILLSKSSLLVRGRHSVSSSRFKRMLNTADDKIFHAKLSEIARNMSSFTYGGDFTLFEALLRFGSCHCSDPRDKVFAVLNILSPPDRASLHMLPDYTFSPAKVSLIALHQIRSKGFETQDQLTLNVSIILRALGAKASRAVERLATSLQEQKRLVDRRAVEWWRVNGTTEGWKWEAPLTLPGSLATREKLSRKALPGMTLTAVNVFDCLFGWHRITHADGRSEWITDIYEDRSPDVWSSDYIDARPERIW